jgi:ssDNA-binding Zn-finger/Zn-ribbon topoisomerase 1
MKKHLCMDCGIEMKKSITKYKGLPMEVLQCPKCKVKIYTEEQAHKAILKLEAQKLKGEYIKKAIKIGHSWGITFPKEIANLFELNKPQARLKIHPNLEKGKIELSVN